MVASLAFFVGGNRDNGKDSSDIDLDYLWLSEIYITLMDNEKIWHFELH